MDISTVLFDLDGVIRHFDPGHVAAVEQRHGLANGVLTSTAFASPLIDQVITGAITRHQWTVAVGEQVGHPSAAWEWMRSRGTIDEEVMALIGELRTVGLTVAILTNGTDTIDDELEELGVARRVDHVFNSATIGVAKPARGAFEFVCRALAVAPAAVFFTDDSDQKLGGAIELGMTTHHFTGLTGLRLTLAAALPPGLLTSEGHTSSALGSDP